MELRRRISECFELAALPGVTEEECRTLLHFVVVGGGPTGMLLALGMVVCVATVGTTSEA